MKSVKPKQYTRSPQYGKFQSFTPTGKSDYVDLMSLEVEYEGDEYKVGQLFATSIINKGKTGVQGHKIKELEDKVAKLERNNKRLVAAIKELELQLDKVLKSNKIIY